MKAPVARPVRRIQSGRWLPSRSRSEATLEPLKGLCVLLVEDEAIVSMLAEEMLADSGCAEVLRAVSVAGALEVLARRRPDAVVLDVNLRGEACFPVADALAAAGIPFVFTTGYGAAGLPPQWQGRPVVDKPYEAQMLADGLAAALRAPER